MNSASANSSSWDGSNEGSGAAVMASHSSRESITTALGAFAQSMMKNEEATHNNSHAVTNTEILTLYGIPWDGELVQYLHSQWELLLQQWNPSISQLRHNQQGDQEQADDSMMSSRRLFMERPQTTTIRVSLDCCSFPPEEDDVALLMVQFLAKVGETAKLDFWLQDDARGPPGLEESTWVELVRGCCCCLSLNALRLLGALSLTRGLGRALRTLLRSAECRLTCLEIYECEITRGQGGGFYSALSQGLAEHARGLHKLTLHSCEMNDKALKLVVLGGIIGFGGETSSSVTRNTLQSFTLGEQHKLTSESWWSLAALLNECTNLKEFKLQQCFKLLYDTNLDDKAFRSFVQRFQEHPRLERFHLDLYGSMNSDLLASVFFQALQVNTTLTHLRLENRLGKDLTPYLARSLPSMRGIKTLEIQRFEPESVAFLEALRKNTNVTDIRRLPIEEGDPQEALSVSATGLLEDMLQRNRHLEALQGILAHYCANLLDATHWPFCVGRLTQRCRDVSALYSFVKVTLLKVVTAASTVLNKKRRRGTSFS